MLPLCHPHHWQRQHTLLIIGINEDKDCFQKINKNSQHFVSLSPLQIVQCGMLKTSLSHGPDLTLFLLLQICPILSIKYYK